MVDRRLVLHVEGAPVCWDIGSSGIRNRILGYPDDFADMLKVWEVPSVALLVAAEDITERFAWDWSREFEFGDGIEPSDYLARFPAFVLEHVRIRLIQKWEAALAQRDSSFLPNPVRKAS